MHALDTYLRTQWSLHATAPLQVAAGFERGFALLKAGGRTSGRMVEMAKLVEHTLLAHCADVPQAQQGWQSLRALGLASRPAESALRRLEFALAVAQGLHPPPPPLADDQVLPGCVNGLVANCAREGAEASLRWLAGFRDGLGAASRSRLKAVAGAMNCLSYHLCRLSQTEDARAVTVAAALLSRDARARTGNWRRLSQAERFLALTWVQLGDGPEAVAAALRCEALCTTQGAPPEEHLLAAEALARAAAVLGDTPAVARAMARMQALVPQVADAAARQQGAALYRETAGRVGWAIDDTPEAPTPGACP